MRDWRAKLDAFLAFNEREILKDGGRISAEVAQKLALDEYDKFERRRLEEEASAPDDFEETVRRLNPQRS
jgi:hypothetical protein